MHMREGMKTFTFGNMKIAYEDTGNGLWQAPRYPEVDMNADYSINEKERAYLRELAKKYLEYASQPVMGERKQLWCRHNSLKGERPVIVMEYESFIDEIMPALKCESKIAREMEQELLKPMVNYDMINDDQVISPYYSISWDIHLREFDMEIKREYAKDQSGMALGFSVHHPISDLERDLSKLKPSTYWVHREGTLRKKNFIEEVMGDILPVKIRNDTLRWHAAPSMKVVELMGLETMMYSILDYPDEMHALYRFITDDILAFIKWQEREGLLILNNENQYTGAGSRGFTHELPTEEYKRTSKITTKDIWGNMNSQETVGISPEMYGEFIFPYYKELSEQFGLTYYGCCEPVHGIWDKYVSKLYSLRKVSVSPWCDEEFMGIALKGSNVIYSRKPSPNFIGVMKEFDIAAYRNHISHTLKAAQQCSLEFIFRDIYTLKGDITKPGTAVKILRELIEE